MPPPSSTLAQGHFLITSPTYTYAIQPATNPIMVQLPNGNKIVTTHTMTLPIPDLPLAAGQAHIFPDLMVHSLISIGQLCDHRCEALFTAKHVVITKNGKPIITGNHCLADSGQPPLNLLPHSIHKPTLCMTTHHCQLRLSHFFMHPCSAW